VNDAVLDEPARLAAVADYVAVRPQARDDLEALCELATLLCEVPYAAVNLIDDRSQHQIAAHGIDPAVCAREESMCAVTIGADEDLFIPDASQDDRFARNPWVDGRLGHVRLYGSARLRSPAGQVVGTLCVFDAEPGTLPPRRQAALAKLADQAVDVLELQLRIAELARSQQALAEFAGQLSHDLKTPLTATVGFAELLSERPAVRTDETALGYAQRCLSSGRRMLATIDQLLAYARVGGTLHRRSVPLAEVLPAVLEDLGHLPADVHIEWSAGDVPADPAHLRALLQNLVGNAVKYRPPGRPLTVRVGATETEAGVEVVVADDGTGIPPEHREDALAPLTRLRSDVSGSGLGLAICNRVVAAHGGRLELADAAGGGLVVTALFPR
jgi:signal transduction histidine kinase